MHLLTGNFIHGKVLLLFLKSLIPKSSSSHWIPPGLKHIRQFHLVLPLLMLSLCMECLLPFFYQKTVHPSSLASKVTFFFWCFLTPARKKLITLLMVFPETSAWLLKIKKDTQKHCHISQTFKYQPNENCSRKLV